MKKALIGLLFMLSACGAEGVPTAPDGSSPHLEGAAPVIVADTGGI